MPKQVDLSNYKNDQIHELLKERGLQRVDPASDEADEPSEDREKDKAEPSLESQSADPRSETEKRAEAIKNGEKPKTINKQEVLDKLKNLKHPFGKAGGIFDKLKNIGNMFPSEAIDARKKELEKEKNGNKEIPAEAEPEYESPTADERTVRSNKRTETTAPVPSEKEKNGNKEIPAEAEPEYESPTANEGTVRSNKRTETTAPVPAEDKKKEEL